jgi:UDP-N-acetylglucosamine acyltransferase
VTVAATHVHPTASVDPAAELGSGVAIGPYAVIGPNVTIGDGAVIGPHAVLERFVRIGAGCKIGVGAILGGLPQDLKFKGEETWVEIGDGTEIRDLTTINRGTTQSYKTTVGRNCLLMTYVHLGHDCHVGDGVILSNMVQLAGHVHIGEKATLGGMTGVHQFVHIGRFAFIGGFSKIAKDVPPFLKVDGNPARPYGLNVIGLRRNGFSKDTLDRLKRTYKHFYRSSYNISQALDRATAELPQDENVRAFVDFIGHSQRGVLL